MTNSIKQNVQANFFVITGGPGVGKTTLLKELKRRDYSVVPEIARKLIKEQKLKNGDVLPWKNKERFKNKMFAHSIQSFQHMVKSQIKKKPVFFDRGFIDSLCYANLIKSEIGNEMETYAKNWRYNNTVFMLPPWKEIYETDSERKQNWDEALLTYKLMTQTYLAYGYTLIEVPKESVKERADFVLNTIKKYNL